MRPWRWRWTRWYRRRSRGQCRRFIGAGVANSDTIAIAVTGAGDATLIELVYRRRRAGAFIAGVNRHAARAESHRLCGTAIVGEGLQIDLRGGCHGCATASSVVGQIVAVRGERGIVIAISTQRAVGDNGVLERRGADVVDDTAASARAIAREGAVGHIQQRAGVQDAAAGEAAVIAGERAVSHIHRAAIVVEAAAAIADAIAGKGAVGYVDDAAEVEDAATLMAGAVAGEGAVGHIQRAAVFVGDAPADGAGRATIAREGAVSDAHRAAIV